MKPLDDRLESERLIECAAQRCHRAGRGKARACRRQPRRERKRNVVIRECLLDRRAGIGRSGIIPIVSSGRGSRLLVAADVVFERSGQPDATSVLCRMGGDDDRVLAHLAADEVHRLAHRIGDEGLKPHC